MEENEGLPEETVEDRPLFMEGETVYHVESLTKKNVIRAGIVTELFDGGLFLVLFDDKKLPVMCLTGGKIHDGGTVLQMEKLTGKASEIMQQLLAEGTKEPEDVPEPEEEVTLESPASGQGTLF